jgi:Fe-S oxidoreductase
MENRYPTEFVGAFKSLETQSNPWGFGRNTRSDWAKELDVKTWDKHNPTEYLYFVGCNGSFDDRGKKIATAVVQSLKSAGVDFSILGNDEGCTGDPARRAGNEYLFDQLALRNVEQFKEKSIKKIITHCPHCFNCLKNEYPEFGVALDVVHHSELLMHRVSNVDHIPKFFSFGNAVHIANPVHQKFGMVHNIKRDTKFRVLVLETIKAMWAVRNNFLYRFFFKLFNIS